MPHAAPPAAAAALDSGFCSVLTDDGRVVCERCLVADTPRLRMRGLLGRAALPEGEGLLIRPTNAIHMWFMRFAIDAVFLDKNGDVLRVAERLQPWRMAACRGAKSVLELTAGSCEAAGVRPGDRLVLAASTAPA